MIEHSSLNITVIWKCNHCEEYQDLFEDENLTDEGWLYDLMLEDYNMGCNDKTFSEAYSESFGEEYRCPKCEEVVEIGEVGW